MLIKYIDAAKNLSVQVHPNDEYAQKYEHDNGKTEMWYIVSADDGAGKKYKSLVMLTLGTGVGSGIVFNGKLFEGNLGAGVELGHEVIKIGGEKCTCGRKGCLEAMLRQPLRYVRHKRLWKALKTASFGNLRPETKRT